MRPCGDSTLSNEYTAERDRVLCGRRIATFHWTQITRYTPVNWWKSGLNRLMRRGRDDVTDLNLITPNLKLPCHFHPDLDETETEDQVLFRSIHSNAIYSHTSYLCPAASHQARERVLALLDALLGRLDLLPANVVARERVELDGDWSRRRRRRLCRRGCCFYHLWL